MADYAIHDTTLTGISNVIRKKDGTSALIDPADYADRINLMGMLEEKTVSGTIAHITDGADGVPLKKCEVTLPASLDGYSEIGCTQTGVNVLNTSAFETYSNWSTDLAPNGSYPTGNANRGFEIPVKSGVTYTVSFGMDAETFPTYLYLCRTDGSTSERLIYFSGANYSLSSGTFTAQSGWTYYFRLGSTGSEATFNTQISKLSFEQMEIGSTVSTYEPSNITISTVNLGRTVYGGTADVVSGQGVDENGNAFTFTPITPTPETALGVNNFWADEGDSSVTYRGQGTTTPILPTLVTKTITENGTYSAEDDDADGYSEVTVDVESIVKIGINSGKLNIANGTITADSAWCYTDTFDCPSGNITMDFGESGLNVGIELVNASDNSHANYWSCGNDLRYREVDISSYYSPTKKARLSFKKANLSKVLLMDFGNGKIYSSLNASQFEEPQVSLLSMNNAQSEESEVSENE